MMVQAVVNKEALAKVAEGFLITSAGVVSIMASGNTAGYGKSGDTPDNSDFDIDDANSFENSNIKDVESYLDKELSEFTKAPLKRGEGVRYFDGKGNSWQLNYGYENATDIVHSASYLKTTVNAKIMRIPLIK
ncbi:hypothetical protein [Enterococcus sp. LJL51]|uniref:hypothetical protein n=1 Tax=Enterococcus sp. LJL51 TaxID=3416656 RepID=UPI003CEAE2D3